MKKRRIFLSVFVVEDQNVEELPIEVEIEMVAVVESDDTAVDVQIQEFVADQSVEA